MFKYPSCAIASSKSLYAQYVRVDGNGTVDEQVSRTIPSRDMRQWRDAAGGEAAAPAVDLGTSHDVFRKQRKVIAYEVK